jgi:hypothetical protein
MKATSTKRHEQERSNQENFSAMVVASLAQLSQIFSKK